MTGSEDRAAVPIPPPLIFFALLAAGGSLEYFFPSKPVVCPVTVAMIAGAVLSIISGLLAVTSFAVLIRNKTTFNPAKPTTVIVRDGPFRLSRNPMYLALLLLLAGIAAYLCSLWLFLAVIALYVTLDLFVIRREEEYLTRKFGQDYLAYKSSVRRWL